MVKGMGRKLNFFALLAGSSWQMLLESHSQLHYDFADQAHDFLQDIQFVSVEEVALGNTLDLISLYFQRFFSPFSLSFFLKEQGYETVYWGLWDLCKAYSPDKANLTISVWKLLIDSEWA